MQNQVKFCTCFSKTNTNLFLYCINTTVSSRSVRSSVNPPPNTRKLFLRLSVRDDELSSTPKIITSLAKSLSNLDELNPSNVIP